MKKYLSILIAAAGLLCACASEPAFPDPGLDNIKTETAEMRRDTIDSYTLHATVDAPNGIHEIQVLNGRNYDVIGSFSQYRGRKKLDFTYTVDLTPVLTDTTMFYIVKVIDADMRTSSKGFVLNVHKFSAPEIHIVGNTGVIGLTSPDFELKAVCETGMNFISKIRVLFGDEPVDVEEFPGEEAVSNYTYRHLFTGLALKLDSVYQMEVELTDHKGAICRSPFKIRLLEPKHPKKVSVFGSGNPWGTKPQSVYWFFYNESGNRLDSIIVDGYTYDGKNVTKNAFRLFKFSYNETGQVTRYTHYAEVTSMGKTTTSTNEVAYTYDDFYYRLTKVETKDKPDNTLYVREWDGKGNVARFSRGTQSESGYVPVKYAEIPGKTDAAFSDLWSSVNVTGDSGRSCRVITATKMPTYLPGLPPLPTENLFTGDLQNLLFYQYVFLQRWNDAGPQSGQYQKISAQTDDRSGQVTAILIKGMSDNVVSHYAFEYE